MFRDQTKSLRTARENVKFVKRSLEKEKNVSEAFETEG